jgi:hypothetical protein
MSRYDLWIKKGLTLTDRLNAVPAVDRDIDPGLTEKKINRGGFQQQLRLKYYPSIKVDFDSLYAGTFRGSKEELVNKLFDMGYRNNPTSYVEVTDEFGPDDGSFAKHKVEEDVGFPHLNIDRPLGILPIWNRVKHQTQVVIYVDGEEIHMLAHEETSAPLQPMRHLTIQQTDAVIGIRELREDWFDQFDTKLPAPL